MSPLQALQARERRGERRKSAESATVLRISLTDVPAGLMLAFTADRGWHWALNPSDAEWAALEA